MARPDLTNAEVQQMGRENPGSAAEYLRLRREELEEEKHAEMERIDQAQFTEVFIAEGGDPAEAGAMWKRLKDEHVTSKAAASRRAEESATQTVRDSINQAL